MLRQCITLAVLGCAFAIPIAQYQIQQQQDEGIPPHLLRQYIGGGQPQAQHIPRPAPPPTPAPARLPYNVQEQEQYQPRPQYQPQPQPQPQQQYRPQQQPEDYDPNPSYQFGFDVSDDKFTNYQNRQEQRDGDMIKGSYSVVDSDGFIRTVTYTADPKEGFRAEVSRKPTDIVVKYPTPKPQVLQPQAPQQQQAAYQPQQVQQQQQHQQQPRPQQANPQYYRYE